MSNDNVLDSIYLECTQYLHSCSKLYDSINDRNLKLRRKRKYEKLLELQNSENIVEKIVVEIYEHDQIEICSEFKI